MQLTMMRFNSVMNAVLHLLTVSKSKAKTKVFSVLNLSLFQVMKILRYDFGVFISILPAFGTLWLVAHARVIIVISILRH